MTVLPTIVFAVAAVLACASLVWTWREYGAAALAMGRLLDTCVVVSGPVKTRRHSHARRRPVRFGWRPRASKRAVVRISQRRFPVRIRRSDMRGCAASRRFSPVLGHKPDTLAVD